MKKILLQTTIEYAKDDWCIERFSILTDLLSATEDQPGKKLFQVTARNRENLASGDDRILRKLDETDSIMRNPANPSGRIKYLLAHPHEGAISVPPGETHARVIAVGKSLQTSHLFNLTIAFDGNANGRAVVDSSFHHFVDYNFDPRMGSPSFVTEAPGCGLMENATAREDAKMYVLNIARWLAE